MTDFNQGNLQRGKPSRRSFQRSGNSVPAAPSSTAVTSPASAAPVPTVTAPVTTQEEPSDSAAAPVNSSDLANSTLKPDAPKKKISTKIANLKSGLTGLKREKSVKSNGSNSSSTSQQQVVFLAFFGKRLRDPLISISTLNSQQLGHRVWVKIR